ncbi:unnamed protein product [Staurois parvus]|uniref:Uncharacterized protein n=1 Tax=Staurois parvus TaxID=386267 RepID=A0ABN9FTG6_9NEOB|nr:unnamed protein product [Staurois parvus]
MSGSTAGIGSPGMTAGTGSPGIRSFGSTAGTGIRYRIIWINSGHRVNWLIGRQAGSGSSCWAEGIRLLDAGTRGVEASGRVEASTAGTASSGQVGLESTGIRLGQIIGSSGWTAGTRVTRHRGHWLDSITASGKAVGLQAESGQARQ